MIVQMKRRIEQGPRPSQAKLSLVGSSLPERMRAATFALLGLITAAGLSLVLLFAQTTLPIPSLGPVTGPLTVRQALEGGVVVATAGGASAGSGRGSSGSTGSLAVSTPTSAPGSTRA